MASIARVKTLLQLPGSGGETEANAPDNLGIYGLGRRRSLEQLEGFARLNLQTGEGNVGLDHCANHEWVPYDTKVSPTENLYINPSNLDPQPEYPLRTKMIYYEQQQYLSEFQSLTIPDERNLGGSASSHELLDRFDVSHTSALPPVSLLFVFWIVGLCAWVMVFLVPQLSGSASSKSRGGSHKKSTNMYKNV